VTNAVSVDRLACTPGISHWFGRGGCHGRCAGLDLPNYQSSAIFFKTSRRELDALSDTAGWIKSSGLGERHTAATRPLMRSYKMQAIAAEITANARKP